MYPLPKKLSGSRRVSGSAGGAPVGGAVAALRYRHTETHIFPATNLAPKVSRDPQTDSWGKKMGDACLSCVHACAVSSCLKILTVQKEKLGRAVLSINEIPAIFL